MPNKYFRVEKSPICPSPWLFFLSIMAVSFFTEQKNSIISENSQNFFFSKNEKNSVNKTERIDFFSTIFKLDFFLNKNLTLLQNFLLKERFLERGSRNALFCGLKNCKKFSLKVAHKKS